MQAIVVALAVLKKERCRPGLTGPMATLEEGSMIVRIADGGAHGLIPAVRDAGETRIERGPEFRDDVRKWIGEVFVLAAPEAMLRHHDPSAEPLIDGVGVGERRTFFRPQHRRHGRATMGIELVRDALPIERRDPPRNARHGGGEMCFGRQIELLAARRGPRQPTVTGILSASV